MVPDTAILLSPMGKVESNWHTDTVEPRDNWLIGHHYSTTRYILMRSNSQAYNENKHLIYVTQLILIYPQHISRHQLGS